MNDQVVVTFVRINNLWASVMTGKKNKRHGEDRIKYHVTFGYHRSFPIQPPAHSIPQDFKT